MNRRAFKAGEREVLTVDEYKDHVYIGSFVMKAEQPEEFKPADTRILDRAGAIVVMCFGAFALGVVFACWAMRVMHR